MTFSCSQNHLPVAWEDARCTAAKEQFESVQARFCALLEAIEAEKVPEDGQAARFTRLPWRRGGDEDPDQGGGVAMLLRGNVFEKAGVHSSTVYGEFAPEFRHQIAGAAEDARFWATGVSIIVHPRNPHIPAVHMNCRHIVTTRAWYGGGADLTPHLDPRRRADDLDVMAFHEALKRVCDAHKCADYHKFQEACARYFYLPHRNEERGVGGIFFDDLACDGDFVFVRAVGEAFCRIYPEIVRGNYATSWSAAEREAQLIRRGRYAEFNLLYDRGTTFGLKTGGNTAAILSSLPPVAAWP